MQEGNSTYRIMPAGTAGQSFFQSFPNGDFHIFRVEEQGLIQFSIYLFLELARSPWVIRPARVHTCVCEDKRL